MRVLVYLRVALLLEIGDDTLTNQVGCLDDLKHFLIVLLH